MKFLNDSSYVWARNIIIVLVVLALYVSAAQLSTFYSLSSFLRSTQICVALVLLYVFKEVAKSALRARDFDSTDILSLGIVVTWLGILEVGLIVVYYRVFHPGMPVSDNSVNLGILIQIFGGMLHASARKTISNRIAVIVAAGVGLLLGMIVLGLATNPGAIPLIHPTSSSDSQIPLG